MGAVLTMARFDVVAPSKPAATAASIRTLVRCARLGHFGM